MKNYLILLVLIPILFSAASAHAEVTLDGTLGHAGALPGPDYQIGAEVGQPHGGNLFHSFQDFNLQSHESATFSGPDNVQNIISRVTGGNPSSIDGTLRSTIPNADLYFLNPYGIMFGPNAKLDVQGGFHASTADTLQLQDGGEFNARIPTKGLLTVAPPSAFGFLTDSPATLSLQDSQLIVPYGQTLSLNGGNLSLNGAQVNAPGGQVTLSSLAQAGQFALANPTLSGKGGTIELQNQSKVSTSGIGGGKVLIRGGQLVMDHSAIEAHTLGNQDGQGIDIATDKAVNVKGNLFAIRTPTFGTGRGGNIQITTPRLEVTGSLIDTSTLGSGAGGDLKVQANQVIVQAGAALGNSTFGSGKGGLVQVTARDSITIAGHREGDFNIYGLNLTKDSQILANSFGVAHSGNVQITTSHLIIEEATISTISAGTSVEPSDTQVVVEADSITIKNGGFIASDTFGNQMGGDITLKVTGDLIVTGRRMTTLTIPPPVNLVLENVQSGITSSTFGQGQAGHITISTNRLIIQEGSIATVTIGEGQGSAGEIHITANEIQLDNGGSITSSSGALIGQNLFLGTGDGGEVAIEVAGHLRIQGRGTLGLPSSIASNTLTIGQGGNLMVHANHLQLSDGGIITANSLGLGEAGNLTIQADTLEILDHSQITTSAQQAGGGDIQVTVANQLYLRRGQLTSSVAGGIGNSGNLSIENPQFVVMNHGQVIAQADAGNGGNIHLVADNLLKTPDSLINASSRLGINGQVLITAPDETVSGSLSILPTTFTEVSGLLPRPCTALSFEEFIHRSHLIVNSIAGNPPWPNDLRPSPILLSIQASPNFTEATVSKEKKAESTQRLAWLTGCHQ